MKAAALLCLCAAVNAADLSRQIAALDRERDRAKLEIAAVEIANSSDAGAIQQLGDRLAKRSFLNRLDRPNETEHLSRVFDALAAHPSQAVEQLSIRLAFDPEFASLPVRVDFVLNALAAVRPVSPAGAEVFRKTGRSGYLEVNGPLLAANGSPLGLQVLEEYFSDPSLDQAQLISMAHWSLLPVRTHAEIIAMCARLLIYQKLPKGVQTAVAESLFDYRPREWFGVTRNQPKPAGWAAADAHAKELARKLGSDLLGRGDLDKELRAAIERTLASL